MLYAALRNQLNVNSFYYFPALNYVKNPLSTLFRGFFIYTHTFPGGCRKTSICCVTLILRHCSVLISTPNDQQERYFFLLIETMALACLLFSSFGENKSTAMRLNVAASGFRVFFRASKHFSTASIQMVFRQAPSAPSYKFCMPNWQNVHN